MIDLDQFRNLIIEPTLKELELYSVAAVELVLGTAIQESRLSYLKQLGGGPAMGPFQMEPATHDDIFENYLQYQGILRQRVMAQVRSGFDPDANNMAGNLYYACAMCRVHYYRSPDPLPKVGDLPAQARMWKRVYNTPLGAGTEAEYIENWENAHST